jgi:type II secretory pathway pseudopilin PulG
LQVWHVLLIILVILIVALVVLYFLGKRLQKRQAAQQEQIEAAKQQVTLLIIDKKRMPLKDSGLPQAVIDQVPKLMRRNKMPVVKVKMGPRIMTMIADEKIFDIIPVKKEVKATVSGIYITDVRAAHGKLDMQPQKKKGIRAKLFAWRDKAQSDLNSTQKKSSKK